MEERKRPIPHDSEDGHPPFKRQALQTSSQTQSSHQVPQSQEDVIHFQKEAIWRQMQEYKRERNLLESRVEELDKRSVYHDDHLRVADAWWDQLLDEVKLLTGEWDMSINSYQNGDTSEFPSSLLFDDVTTFAEHLKEKRNRIIDSLKKLFHSLKSNPSTKTEGEKVDQLQAKIRQLLVNEKVNKVEISRLEKEVEGANARLAEATVKYLTAEKKVDRLKSQTLAKIERQAMFNSNASQESKKESEDSQSAKDREISAKVAEGHVADVEQALKELQAVVTKQKENIQQLQAENARMSDQVTTFTIKFGRLSEEEISSCDAYKNLKVRLDDLASRYNHIEAVNKELTDRAETLESERTSFKEKVLEEQEQVRSEMQTQLSKAENDLSRIRATRDELLKDQSHRKLREEQKLSSLKEAHELAEARLSRIEALELEVQRLKELLKPERSSDASIASMGLEEIRQKYEQLEKANKVLSQELPGLEQAYKKAHELGTKKVAYLQETEEKLKRLLAEKNKAESKYFAVMKAKEALVAENRALKTQNAKSTEIISQLKEAEKRCRDILSNYEKQLAELKSVNQAAVLKNRESQARINEHENSINSLKAQIGELSVSLRHKDAMTAKEAVARRESEIEVERLTARLENVEKLAENNRPKESENKQLEALRTIALCSVCRNRFKNTAIRICGHVFCKQCADERIASRSRKCPNCGRGFAATDLIPVHL